MDGSILNKLSGVVLLIQSTLAVDDPVTPTPLRDTMQLLHGESLCNINRVSYREVEACKLTCKVCLVFQMSLVFM